MGVSSSDFPSSMGQSKNHVLLLIYLKNGTFLKQSSSSLQNTILSLVSN
jgi:hypothetical protein